jgi:hypothetical protein
MSTRSARECTIFAPAQHLRNLREQRPSNKSDIDSIVMGKGRVLHGGEPACGLILVPQHVIVVGLRFKCYIL